VCVFMYIYLSFYESIYPYLTIYLSTYRYINDVCSMSVHTYTSLCMNQSVNNNGRCFYYMPHKSAKHPYLSPCNSLLPVSTHVSLVLCPSLRSFLSFHAVRPARHVPNVEALKWVRENTHIFLSYFPVHSV
jgi:hypothetical protein